VEPPRSSLRPGFSTCSVSELIPGLRQFGAPGHERTDAEESHGSASKPPGHSLEDRQKKCRLLTMGSINSN